jgi:cobalt/nickel transport system permease protein
LTHQWHDAFRHPHPAAGGESGTPAHHLDPRSKIFAGLAFVLTVLCTHSWSVIQFTGYPLLLIIAMIVAKLSPRGVFKRVFSLLPFAFLMLLSAVFSRLSYAHVVDAVLKAVLSMTGMALVSMTTPFPDLLRALEQCRVPNTLVMFLAFLYRYAAVLAKEVVRAERGWASRTFGGFWWREASRAGHVLAALLIRSYERAERVYAAMLARGFSNRMPEIHVLHFGLADLAFAFLFAGSLLVIRWGHV